MTPRAISLLRKFHNGPAAHNGHVLGAVAFLALPACVFSVPFIAPLTMAAALAALLLGPIRERRWPDPPREIAVLMALIVLYGLLSACWAVEPRQSLILAGRLAGIFAAGLLLLDAAQRLRPDERAWFERAFLAGFLLGALLILVESATDARLIAALREAPWVEAIIGKERPLYFAAYFSREASLASLLVWPAAAILRRRFGWIWALGLAALTLVLVLIANSETARIAYFGGLLLFFLALGWPRALAPILGMLLCLALLAAPLLLRPAVIGWTTEQAIVPYAKESSLAHRVAIWSFVTGKIAERPLLGWGLDSSRAIPGGHAEYNAHSEILPLHPHDMALQIWLELGLPGAFLGVALLLAVTRRASLLAERPAAAAFALAALGTAAINGASGYDLWHPWWLCFLWLTATFLVAALGEDEKHASLVAEA
jgi:exopolysaccharide production protein ExoQ